MAPETNPTPPMTDGTASPAPAPPPKTPPRVPWAGLVLAVCLLATSGAVRAWQSWGVNEALRQGRQSPFPLDRLPMDLGDWKGEARELDPEIARATGCTDHVFRSYRNSRTGSRIDLILLYGPTLEVIKHSPVICYPSAGFTYAAVPEPRTVEVGRDRYPFSSMVFTKGESAEGSQEVYYTWGLARPGQSRLYWAPDMGAWKHLARIPGLYKVHLQRTVGPLERREFGNPCESFLADLMPWIDQQYRQAAHGPKATPSPPS